MMYTILMSKAVCMKGLNVVPLTVFLTFSFSFSDIDDCGGHLCENGGQCVDGVNEYTCNCADGYDGQYCANSKTQQYIRQNCMK